VTHRGTGAPYRWIVSEQSSWLRALRRNPALLDALIALGLTLLSLASFFTGNRTPQQPREADILGVVLVVIAAGSLAFRRRWPVAVLAVSTSATLAVYLLDYPDSGLPFVVIIALYTLAARCDRKVTVVATVAVLLVIAFPIAIASEMDGGSLAGALAVFTLAAVLGDGRKVQLAYAEQLELRAQEKERERVEAARRAVTEERLRIARELHDVVAHAMSVVAVQSGVGAHVIDSRPEEAKHILETISRTSRGSLDEMRRLLGVLRTDPATPDAADDLAPAPGLGGLDELAARVADAGVPVETDVQGEQPDIPAGVDLAAYRIVQEALTNVLKHAGPARASVLVRYDPDAVHVEVVDDGRGAGSSAVSRNGSGNGLVGMRERAALYGGKLEAGPRPGGGYRVAATLRYAS
jgi:signal transduction histidine kinase